MKQLVFAIILTAIFSFKTNEEKKLKVELTVTEWNAVFNVLEESNAPNLQVKAVKKILLDQLQPQLKDSVKSK